MVAEADGARQASIAQAKGQAQGFDSIYKAYQAAKDVTLRRLYIETMQAIVSKTPTTVLDNCARRRLPLLNLGAARARSLPARGRGPRHDAQLHHRRGRGGARAAGRRPVVAVHGATRPSRC